MSGKLDQSLEDITKTRRSTARSSNRRGGRAATTAKSGPSAGVTKSTRATKKNTAAVAATVPIAATGEGKIIVSGLPTDVTEIQIKDYFQKTIGGVKRVFLTYGPGGQSRGIATITFTNAQKAHQTAKDLNGTKVDNKPMKIEVVLGAAQAPAPAAPKGLGDRIAQPKNAAKTASAKGQPKNAATTAKTAATRGKAKGRGGKSGKSTRKPKTAEDLDAEMTDYFGGNNASADANGTAAAAAAAPAAADAGMSDEIM